MFLNRIDAGLMLAEKLRKYKNDPVIVLAIPRGGVPVAYAVAKELNFPVEVTFTKKIGHPMNKEYAIGAASLSDYFIKPHDDVTQEYIDRELQKVRHSLKEMYTLFMGNTEPADLKDKTVIVIDDGVATGNTLLAIINVLRKRKPARIIIGVPVASRTAVLQLSAVADEVITVLIPDEFHGVGAFYEDFAQVSNEEVLDYLAKLRQLNKA